LPRNKAIDVNFGGEMRFSALLIGAIGVFGATACSGGDRIAGPSGSPQPYGLPATPPNSPSPFPAVTRPGSVYNEKSRLYAAPTDPSAVSRYVLYDDGTFELQFQNRFGSFAFGGHYQTSNGTVTLAFEGANIVGLWEATASLQNDEMSVMYNEVMVGADFVNGVYAREQ